TIYVYFQSKEDLVACLVREGMQSLLASLREQLGARERSSGDELELVIRELVASAMARPSMFQLMRSVLPAACRGQFVETRMEIVDLVVGVIQRGIERGEMADSAPELTGQYLVAAVRGVALFGRR